MKLPLILSLLFLNTSYGQTKDVDLWFPVGLGEIEAKVNKVEAFIASWRRMYFVADVQHDKWLGPKEDSKLILEDPGVKACKASLLLKMNNPDAWELTVHVKDPLVPNKELIVKACLLKPR